jgi:hypothetical protein
MPRYHGPPGSSWYSTRPRILPHNVLIRRRTLFASSVGTGKGRESTDGGGDMCGEVGRVDIRLISRDLENFFSFPADVLRPAVAGICMLGDLVGTTEG